MTDELKIEDEVLDDNLEVVEQEQEQKEEQQPAVELPNGYKTKEQLLAEGKDPSGWLPPEAFAERKERFKVESKYRREVEEMRNQMANLNKFHAQQLKVMREQLESKRDDAILTGDVKEVKRLDGQLDELKQQTKPAQDVQKLPEEQEWEEENQWIYDQNDPRTEVALRVYAEQINSGKTVAGALRAVDKAVSGIIPQSRQERRPAAAVADSSRNTAPKRGNDAPTVTWDSLSADDVAVYEADPTLWGSKTEFLKSVANSRRK